MWARRRSRRPAGGKLTGAGIGSIKERCDSDNIAAVQAILSDVVCGVVGVVVMMFTAVSSRQDFKAVRAGEPRDKECA